MNLSMTEKLTAVCNWAMAAASVLMAAYVVLQMFAPPPQSQALGTVPDLISSPAADGAATPAAVPNVILPPSALAGPTASTPPGPNGRPGPPQGPPTGPAGVRQTPAADSAPRVRGPIVPIPPLNPGNLPPGVGKDF